MMHAGIAENPPPINKMMINWAEKQAPEDRQATEDVADNNDAIWAEEPEAFVESEDEQERKRDNLSYCKR